MSFLLMTFCGLFHLAVDVDRFAKRIRSFAVVDPETAAMDAYNSMIAAPWPSQQIAACCCQEAMDQRRHRHSPHFAKPSVASHHSCNNSSSHSRAHQCGWRGSCGPVGSLLPLLLLLLLSLLQIPEFAAARLLRGDDLISASDRTNAQQQPCVDCRSCITSGCLRMCSQGGCRPTAAYSGMGVTAGGGGASATFGVGYDPTACKQSGLDLADNVAGQACRTVQVREQLSM
jgi:hypothetical protein